MKIPTHSSACTSSGFRRWIKSLFATDLPKLAALRAKLREEMEASTLMDEPGFAEASFGTDSVGE